MGACKNHTIGVTSMSQVPPHIRCPQCSKTFRGKSKYFGKKVRCQCGRVFRVHYPRPSATAVPAGSGQAQGERPYRTFRTEMSTFSRLKQAGKLPFDDDEAGPAGNA